MSETTPQLDDRTLQDLVDGAKRLIPVLCPEWTNHGPSDPGMALIEVFAWMTDHLVQRLNDVPSRVYDELLRLIGLELFPASAAAVDVLFTTATPIEDRLDVPAGTTVATGRGAGGAASIEFQTVRDAEFGPRKLIAVMTMHGEDARDITDDLALGSRVSVLAADDASVLLGFAHSCADHQLQIDVDVELVGIGVDPAASFARWEVTTSEGWEPLAVLADATGGLRRSGSTVVVVGANHQSATIGGTTAFWLRIRRDADARSPGVGPVEIGDICAHAIGGQVRASHSSPMPGELLGTADGSPSLTVATTRAPVLPLAFDERVMVIEPWTSDGAGAEWTQVADFSQSAEDDHHYIFSSATGSVRFGPRIHGPDGTVRQHGRIPPAGSEIRITGYRVGGGAVGNVGTGTIRALQTAIPQVASVTNPSPATGGADAESIDNARARAPMWLQTADRAVTASDYERVARWAHPEVARAHCHAADDGVVDVAIVPSSTGIGAGDESAGLELGDLLPADDVMTAVIAAIDARRMVGARVRVGPARYVGVVVAAHVHARPGRSAPALRHACEVALRRHLHPVIGGRGGGGWGFGRSVDSFDLSAVLSMVDGIDRVVAVSLFAADVVTGDRESTPRDRIDLPADALPLLLSAMVRT